MVEFSVLKKTRFSDLIKWNVSELLSNKVLGKYENQPLTKFLIRSKNAIEIKDGVLYKQITIHQFGAGVSLRCEKYGKEIGTKRQFIAKKGQFIISRIDARNGSFGIVPDFLDGAIVTNDFWLFDIKNADADFLRLMLSSNKINSFWQSKSNGTTNRQRVDFEEFMKSTLPIPPLEEQKSIIKKYHESIAQAEEVEEKVEKEISGIDNYLLSCLQIKINKKERNSGLSFIKFSELAQWNSFDSEKSFECKKYPLVTLASISKDKPVYGAAYKTVNKVSDIRYIRITDINEDGSLSNEVVSASDFSEQYLLQKHDFLFARSGATVGKTFLYEEKYGKAIFAGYLIRFKLNEKIVNPYYLLAFTKTTAYKQWINDNMRIAAQPNSNSQQYSDSLIPLPPLPIQEEIVNHINEIKAQIKELRRQALELREQAKKDFEGSVFE